MAKQKEKPTGKKNLIANAAKKAREAWAERRETVAHRSFRLSRQSELPRLARLPSWRQLIRRTFEVLLGQKSVAMVLLLTYLILAWVISGMFALSGFADIKAVLVGEQAVFSLAGVSALFESFFAAQSSGVNETAAIMLNLVSLLFWLAFIWVARYQIAKKYTSVRAALYASGTSLVPFLLLLAALFIQCVPGFYGLSLLSAVMTGTLFTGSFEFVAFSLLAILLLVCSVYFVISTIIALQIVALPGMYPWAALKNARKLVMGRRFSVLRKYLMVAVFLALMWFALFAPTLLLENAVCGEGGCWVGITILPFVYYFLLGFTLLFASTYLYVTYRSLLEPQEQ